MAEHDADQYTIADLRNDLAGTIRQLRTNDANMTVEKARAVSELGARLIDSAKAEIEMLRVVGRGRMAPTGFIPAEDNRDTLDRQEASASSVRQIAADRTQPKPHIRNPMGNAPAGRL